MASTIARPTTPPNRHAWEQTTYPISPSTYSTGMKSSPRRRPPPAFPNSPRRHREADPRSSSSSVDLATARGETSYPDDHQRQTQYSSERWNGASEDLYGAMGALQTPQMLRVPPTPVTAFPLPTPTMRSRRDSGLALQVDAARPSSIGPSRSPAKASIGLGIAAAVIGNSSSSRGAPALSSEAKTKATSPYAKPMALPSENAQASMANPTAKHTRARSGSVPRARLLIGLRDLAPQYWSVGNGDVTVLIPFDPRSQRQSHSAKSMSPRPGTRANPAQAQVVYCFAAGPSRAGEGSGKNVPPLTPPSATASDSRRVDQTTRHRAAPSNDDGDPDRTPRRPSLELERESPVKPHHPPPVARPVMKYQLHRDFLIVQSAGLRDLLVRPMANGVSAGATAARMSSLRGARLLPSAPGQPMLLWLPLPDPSSFPTLVHWMYWGDSCAIDSALSSGEASWQGMVKNIEYLGLDNDLRRVVRAWWRRWVKVGEAGAGRRNDYAAKPDKESDDERPADSRSASPEPRDDLGEAGMVIDGGGRKGGLEANGIAQMMAGL